jgi:cold-inducible RNA-binding protein
MFVPEGEEVVSVRLFVGNLPYQATEDDVRKHFAQASPPVRVAIPVDRETGRPRGFAFVEFADASQAEQAIRQFNGQPFMGRTLAVNEARAREDRGPSGPRPPMGSRPPMGGASRGPAAGDGGAAQGKGFGPPARRARGGTKREREERRPTGPIPVKVTGRVYDVDGIDDVEDEPIEEFDDFATSLPKDDEPDEDKD